MPEGWSRAGLANVVTLQRGFDLPAQARRPGEVPILGSFGVTGSHDEARVSGPGVTIGRSGASIGVATYSANDFWPLNTALYVKDFHGNDPRWVYWLLHSIDFTAYNSGSAQPSLNRNFLAKIPVNLPPPSEQRHIASFLGALDDVIGLERSTNLSVLDLARAIYRRAVNGSTEAVRLSEVGKWLSGGTPSTSNPAYWDGNVPWISAASLKSFFVSASDRNVTAAGAANGTRLVPKGAILFVVRGMSLKTEFRIGVAQREVAFGQDCKAIIVDGRVPWATVAVGLLAESDAVLQLVDEAGHGTGRLPTDRIEKLVIRLPMPSQKQRVERTLAALLELGADAEADVRIVSEARDELLPLLLSGRVRVGEVAA